jgi:hypothetical protein
MPMILHVCFEILQQITAGFTERDLARLACVHPHFRKFRRTVQCLNLCRSPVNYKNANNHDMIQAFLKCKAAHAKRVPQSLTITVMDRVSDCAALLKRYKRVAFVKLVEPWRDHIGSIGATELLGLATTFPFIKFEAHAVDLAFDDAAFSAMLAHPRLAHTTTLVNVGSVWSDACHGLETPDDAPALLAEWARRTLGALAHKLTLNNGVIHNNEHFDDHVPIRHVLGALTATLAPPCKCELTIYEPFNHDMDANAGVFESLLHMVNTCTLSRLELVWRCTRIRESRLFHVHEMGYGYNCSLLYAWVHARYTRAFADWRALKRACKMNGVQLTVRQLWRRADGFYTDE